MASHLSSIGFPVQTEQDLYSLAEQISQKAKSFSVPQGYYLCYEDPSGATIWLHANKDRHITGMNPHFVGPSVMSVRIVRSMAKRQEYDFDGSYFAWAGPDTQKDEDGAYPFLFDAPDFLRHNKQSFPSILKVQTAAFAHEITIYPHENAFRDDKVERPGLAVEAFVPAGLFAAENVVNPTPPTAHALINGHILDAQKRTNQFTGKSFWWLQLQTYAGVYDAVVDPQQLRTEPRPGYIVRGSFWLSGMILDDLSESRPKTGFLRLLRTGRG